MIGTPVLLPSQENVSRSKPIRSDEKLSVRIMKRETHIRLRAGSHQRGRGRDIPAETGYPIEIVQRHPQFRLALMTDLDSGTVLAQIGTFESDKKGIEVCLHRFLKFQI